MINNNNKIGIIIQARMGSTRLPAKIMMDIKNKSILEYQLKRLDEIECPIIIATTLEPQDDVIEKFALDHDLSFFRGDQDNVLKRYYDCAAYFKLDTIIRITSDCPLIDGQVIKQGMIQYQKANNQNLYLSNTLERTFPRGADFEIFSFLQLEDAIKNATEDSDLEHVTPYIWKNKSGSVEIVQLMQMNDFSAFRLTLDTHDDFKLIRILIEDYNASNLSIQEICEVMSLHPELNEINKHIEQKKA